MKTITRFVLYILSTLAFITTSCSEQERILTPQEALLVAHSWTFSDLIMETQDSLLLASADTWKIVLRNHTRTFYKDNTCISSFDPGKKGTWSFSPDGKRLKIDETGGQFDLIVSQLDEITLALKDRNDIADATMTLVYTKK